MNTSTDSTQKMDEDRPGFIDRIRGLFSSTPQSTEDMVAMVDAATENDVIDDDAKRIIEGALEVSEKQAREVMIPRTQMTVLKAGESFTTQLETIMETGHSRYPMVGENMDDILGILLTKDLLPLMVDTTVEDRNDTELANHVQRVLRPAVFIPESKRLNLLLRQFRQDRSHMALVIDEYGSLSGLVTIEDVLEEIVGEIEDEHDSEENQMIRQMSETRFFVSALTTIEDFNKYFGEYLDNDIDNDEFETIGGFVINQFGHLPKRHESIDYQHINFFVSHCDNRRLRSLRVTIKSEEKAE